MNRVYRSKLLPVLAAGACVVWGIGMYRLVSSDPAGGYIYPFCRPGYASSVRPSKAWSTAYKARLVALEGHGLPVAAFELDHIVPLELGGAPKDPANLQLQLWKDARRKDQLEDSAHKAVCAGEISLQIALTQMRNFK